LVFIVANTAIVGLDELKTSPPLKV
jgi:hypothetical protein